MHLGPSPRVPPLDTTGQPGTFTGNNLALNVAEKQLYAISVCYHLVLSVTVHTIPFKGLHHYENSG